MSKTEIVIIDTSLKHENLKFRAELVKSIGLATGAPFGAVALEALLRGVVIDIYFPAKIIIAALSFFGSWFLINQSQAIMDSREWRVERESRRTKHE